MDMDKVDLYLGFLEYHDGGYCAASVKGGVANANANSEPGNRFVMFANALPIKSLQIDASVYSSPILRAVCYTVPNFPAKKIRPNYSVFGVVLVLPEPHEDSVIETYYCLFSNTQDKFTPFVAVDVEVNDSKTVTVVLMEKRAFSLALTHSFACIGYGSRGDGTKDTSDDGLLSVAEIVEKLSIIPEDDVPQDEDKRIFNFDAYCTLDSDTGELLEDGERVRVKINYQTFNYAFLSRFIASPSQSRLEIISSLMCKYGYGFAFKPEDRQYYAVDLLSNYAPGFHNGDVAHYYAGLYNDRYCFNSKNLELFFSQYGRRFLEYARYNKLIRQFDDQRDGEHSILSHDFTDFYAVHLLGQCKEDLKPQFFQSSSGWNNYNYIARHSPLSSSTSLLLRKNRPTKQGGRKKIVSRSTPGYDMSISGKVGQIEREDWKDVLKLLAKGRNSDFVSIMLQDDLNVHTEGSQTSLFEDQVELNKSKAKENKIIGENVKIESVNQRLVYAKYKLNHLRQNYLTQAFKFKHNEGLTYSFNIVYSLFWWLGVHTDVFSRIANNFEMIIDKHENPDYNKNNRDSKEFIPTPSGSSHRIFDDDEDIASDKYSPFFSDDFENFYEFGHNAHLYQDKESLFGKLSIFIERVDENIDGTIVKNYFTTASLTFYSDFTDCNIGHRAKLAIDDDDNEYSYSIHGEIESLLHHEEDSMDGKETEASSESSKESNSDENEDDKGDENEDNESSGGKDNESLKSRETIWEIIEPAARPMHPISSPRVSGLRSLKNRIGENEEDGFDRRGEAGSIRPDITSLREGLGFGRINSALRTYSAPDMENRSNEGNRLMKRPSHREEIDPNSQFDEDI